MADPRQITLQDVKTFMTICGYKFEGEWQEGIVDFLCKHQNVVLQGPRQVTGKTWCVGTTTAARIMMGCRGAIIGFPTARQAKRILFEDIEKKVQKFLSRIPRAVHGGFKRDGQGAASDICWLNGGRLEAWSANNAANVDGLTCNDLIIDESQDATLSTHATFDPFTVKAKRKGLGSTTLLGIGGTKSSLIQIKTKEGSKFNHLLIMPQDIIKSDPSMQEFFDGKKEEFASMMHLYYKHYECREVIEGARAMFQNIPERVEIPENCRNVPVRHVFGIDIGRTSDLTVVTHFEVVDQYANLVDYDAFTGMGFPLQAERLYKFIDRHNYFMHDVVIESNFGVGLIDILRMGPKVINGKVHPLSEGGYIPGLTPVALGGKVKSGGEGLKTTLALNLADMIYRKRLGIKDKIIRDEIEGIMMSVTGSGHTEWDHGDFFSSALMGMFKIGDVKIHAF